MVGDTFGAAEGRVDKPGLGGSKRAAGRLASGPEVPPSTGLRAAALAGSHLPCEVGLEVVVWSAELSGAASFPGELCLEAELALLLDQEGRAEGGKRNRDWREREQRLGEERDSLSTHTLSAPCFLRHSKSP